MHEDLVILFVPGVHLVPVKGDVAAELSPVRTRFRVAPRCVGTHAIADLHAPPRDFRRGGTVRWSQDVHTNVLDGEPVNRCPPGLKGEQHALAVGDRDSPKVGAHPAGTALDPDLGPLPPAAWISRLALCCQHLPHPTINHSYPSSIPARRHPPLQGIRRQYLHCPFAGTFNSLPSIHTEARLATPDSPRRGARASRPGRPAGRGVTGQRVPGGPPAGRNQRATAAAGGAGSRCPQPCSPGNRLLLRHYLRPVPSSRVAARGDGLRRRL